MMKIFTKYLHFVYIEKMYTYSAFMLDTVIPKVTGRKFPSKYIRAALEEHLPQCKHSSIGVVHWECVVDDVIRSYFTEGSHGCCQAKVPAGRMRYNLYALSYHPRGF